MSTSSSSSPILVSEVAAAKMLLHAAKYPSNHIGGYLLGAGIAVNDILPVLHGYPVGE